jgi:DNA-binding transcriptional LysR family regulator
MDLNLVTAFVRVVEAQSFTLAAKSLDLPKSSVSRRVTELEEELGVQLLHRTTRKLSLTEAGRSYFEQAVGALASLEAAADAAAGMDTEPRGIVRVTTAVEFGVTGLAELIAEFSQAYPEIHVELSLNSRIVNLVEEGFDIAVRAGPTRDASLVSRRVGNGDLGLFASPRYLAERGHPKTLADLANHDCVLLHGKHGKALWRLYGPGDELSTVEVSGRVSTDEMLFVRQAVDQGLGIGLLAELGMKVCKSKGFSHVERVLPEFGTRGAEVSVLTPAGAKRPRRVTLLRDFLVDHLSLGCPSAKG